MLTSRALQHYFHSDGRRTKPTIVNTTGFSPNSDAERLRKAMKGLGTDEDAIIAVLGRRTSAERMQIVDCFKTMYSVNLEDELKSELSRDFSSLARMLTRPAARVMGEGLHSAMCGPGTTEKDLVQIACSCSNDELTQMKQQYTILMETKKNSPGRDLIADIRGETSLNFKEMLCLLLQGKQDEVPDQLLKKLDGTSVEQIVNHELAQHDAKELHETGEGTIGTWDNRFMRVFINRTPWQIRLDDLAYQKAYGKTLIEAIEAETSGDFANGLRWIVEYNLDRPRFFAKSIHDCLTGPGTKDKSLMRLIVLRSDIDLEDIKEAYQAEFGASLEDDISSDCSGDYKKLLLALTGCDWQQ